MSADSGFSIAAVYSGTDVAGKTDGGCLLIEGYYTVVGGKDTDTSTK